MKIIEIMNVIQSFPLQVDFKSIRNFEDKLCSCIVEDFNRQLVSSIEKSIKVVFLTCRKFDPDEDDFEMFRFIKSIIDSRQSAITEKLLNKIERNDFIFSIETKIIDTGSNVELVTIVDFTF